jgi:putative spermidine/putrescine transport system substrate-binding protein
MTTRVDRRRVIKGALATAGAFAATGLWSCARDPSATGSDFKGQRLRIFIYSGAWENSFREVFAPAFQQLTGAEVVLDPGWWDAIPKLKASPKDQPPFDLVLTDATQGYPAIREGLFQQIDMKSLASLSKVEPSTLQHWVHKDSYAVPFADSIMVLAYNKSSLEAPPQSWGELLKGKLGQAGLYNSFYMSLFTFACMKADSEGRPGTAHEQMNSNIDGVIEFAKANSNGVKYWWPTSTDMVLSLVKKDVALGNLASNAMLPALRDKPELGVVIPKADRAQTQLMWAIPAGTRQKTLAERAIDVIFSEDMQLALASRGHFTSIQSVAAKVAAADPLWGQIYPSTPEDFSSIAFYPYDAYFKKWDEIVKVWDQEVLRKTA